MAIQLAIRQRTDLEANISELTKLAAEQEKKGKQKKEILEITFINGSQNNTEEKCDVAKIQIYEVMGFVTIFRKKQDEEAFLPKTSVLMQTGGA